MTSYTTVGVTPNIPQDNLEVSHTRRNAPDEVVERAAAHAASEASSPSYSDYLPGLYASRLAYISFFLGMFTG